MRILGGLILTCLMIQNELHLNDNKFDNLITIYMLTLP